MHDHRRRRRTTRQRRPWGQHSATRRLRASHRHHRSNRLQSVRSLRRMTSARRDPNRAPMRPACRALRAAETARTGARRRLDVGRRAPVAYSLYERSVWAADGGSGGGVYVRRVDRGWRPIRTEHLPGPWVWDPRRRGWADRKLTVGATFKVYRSYRSKLHAWLARGYLPADPQE